MADLRKSKVLLKISGVVSTGNFFLDYSAQNPDAPELEFTASLRDNSSNEQE